MEIQKKLFKPIKENKALNLLSLNLLNNLNRDLGIYVERGIIKNEIHNFRK